MSYAMQNVNVQGGPKKRVYKLMGIILSNLILYIDFFFTERFLGKFAANAY